MGAGFLAFVVLERDAHNGGMTTMPFPDPVNRDQARQNAIHFATLADPNSALGSPANLHRAAVWAQIAETFPAIEHQTSVPDPDTTAVLQAIEEPVETFVTPNAIGDTVTLDALLWDVMRVLAMRTLRASTSRSSTVDVTMDEMEGWDIQMRMMGETTIVASLRPR